MAAAIAEALEPFDGSIVLPDPDIGEADGLRYISQPVAVRPDGAVVRIERVRRDRRARRRAHDRPTTSCSLAEVDAAELAEEAARARAAAPSPRGVVGATDEHVGSTVVMLRG